MSSLDHLKNLKVLVGVPSMTMVHARFALCLNAMFNFIQQAKIGSYKSQKVALCNVRGSILANQRVDIVRMALKEGYQYILWIDSDQTFPKSTLHHLIIREVDVVAANIATKSVPASPTARRKPLTGEPNSGMPVFTDPESKGLEEVWRVGTGLMLVKTKVYKDIGVNCFDQPWREDWQKYQGEDWSMCEKIEAAGYKIHVDHDISQVIGHLGEFEYTHAVVGEIAMEAVNGNDSEEDESEADQERVLSCPD